MGGYFTDSGYQCALLFDSQLPESAWNRDAGEQHPVEKVFDCSWIDVLTALEHGFRAQTDVKGKLAELFLSRELRSLVRDGHLGAFDWVDEDGRPDFVVFGPGSSMRTVECKNISSNRSLGRTRVVEVQRTRNGTRDGESTRPYTAREFDLLAVCLFNLNGRWSFRFIQSKWLRRRHADTEELEVAQPVELGSGHHWHDSLPDALADS